MTGGNRDRNRDSGLNLPPRGPLKRDVLLVCLLLAQQETGTDLISLALRYLARHQSENGSWGRRPLACACPGEPAPPVVPLDAPGRARVAALLAELDADDAERRVGAQRDLLREGWAAEPLLREPAGSPERRARTADILRALQGAGTKEDVEITGWALLTFLGAGYSHLSKDQHDGLHWGGVVRAGLRWLIERPEDADGASAGTAVASLAVSEAYGLTNSALYQAAAQRAVDVVVAHPAKDARALAWQVMALKSAELGGLTFPPSAYADRMKEMKRRRSEEPASLFLQAAQTVTVIFIEKNRNSVDVGGLPGADPSRMDIETAYLTSLALFQYDGPSGQLWKTYRAVEKRWIVPSQIAERGLCARGAWAATGTRARLKFACHGALINEFYYAYSLEK